MTIPFEISNKARIAMVEAYANAAEQSGTPVPVRIEIYHAPTTIPGNINVGLTDQVLLATHESNTGADGFEDSSATGSLDARAFANAPIVADGRPDFFRLYDANNEVYSQGSAGLAPSHLVTDSDDYKINEVSRIVGFTVTVPSLGPVAA